MRGHSSGEYDYLFEEQAGELTEEEMEKLRDRHKNVFRYRVKTIRCGDRIEIECYPLYKTYDDIRAAKKHTTREAQKKINERNAKKELIRKIDTNFGKDDYHVTLTYRDNCLPDEKQSLRDIQNFMKRARNYHKTHGLEPLKYVYVVEFADSDNRRKRVHHHAIINGQMDRGAIKKLWSYGHVRVEELTPELGSLEGLARYITKQAGRKKQSKRWGCSRNLKKPIVTFSDHKLSKKKVEQLAKDVEEYGSHIFSRAYKGYVLDTCKIKTSDYMAGAYIHSTMYKEGVNDV